MSGEKLIDAMTDALALANGDMPVGAVTTLSITKALVLGGVQFPAGRYRIERLASGADPGLPNETAPLIDGSR